ncbi:MAG: ribonuclease R [Nitrospirae bacterium]|nr:ribonuclease R [Nitrospirota bacterium]
MITKESITAFFKGNVTKPLRFDDIVFLLDLSSSERRGLKRLLRELCAEGTVVRTRKGLYGPSEEMSLATGYFEAHRDGYGFLISEQPGERDIFIPARATLGAMNNDRVVVRIEDRHRREGRIIRVLERAHSRITGTFEAGRAASYIKPKNRSVPFDLYVAPGDTGKARSGDSVIAEILSYPTDKRPTAGRVVKVLKKPETVSDEVELVMDELNLPRRFPVEVLQEARDLHDRSQADRRTRKRTDLRDLPTVTIDGERARDFDDAVSIERIEGGYRLWVHIADVGYYVRWGTPIDLEARRRGTSVYFPDRVVPMLPQELSEDLCSLKPGEERPAFTVEMDFDNRSDKRGMRPDMRSVRFYPSLIRSDERMTYTSVKKILVDRDPEERGRYRHLIDEFELMGELCNALKQKRIRRGSLDFDLPEPEVVLDMQGNLESIIKSERNFAHIIIEEFMIAANEAVAGYVAGLGIPFLYRVHEEPDPLKLENILKMINTLGIIRVGKGLRARDFPALLRQITGKPEEEILNHMILRSLKQARYSPVNVGHFGLASVSYTHFTSPIRRYPDLVVHRILGAVLEKNHLSDRQTKEMQSILPDIAFTSSRTERQADEAERMVLKGMRVWLMRDKVGEQFDGTVVSVMPHGLRVRLNDYYVEGLLHISYMTDDFYRYDEKAMSLYGVNRKKTFSLGKSLTVRIEKIDMEDREILFGTVS